MGWVNSIWKSYQQKSQFCLSSVSLSVHRALMVRPQQSVSISSCDHGHWIATFCCNCPGHHYVHPRGKYNCGTIPQHDHTLEIELAANTYGKFMVQTSYRAAQLDRNHLHYYFRLWPLTNEDFLKKYFNALLTFLHQGRQLLLEIS